MFSSCQFACLLLNLWTWISETEWMLRLNEWIDFDANRHKCSRPNGMKWPTLGVTRSKVKESDEAEGRFGFGGRLSSLLTMFWQITEHAAVAKQMQWFHGHNTVIPVCCCYIVLRHDTHSSWQKATLRPYICNASLLVGKSTFLTRWLQTRLVWPQWKDVQF